MRDEPQVRHLLHRACAACQQQCPEVECGECGMAFHPLCLTPAVLSVAHLAPEQHWTCCSCGADNTVRMHAVMW